MIEYYVILVIYNKQIDDSIALTSEEYFDFIFGRVAFLDGLNGITKVL